jgi:hypothetical protein
MLAYLKKIRPDYVVLDSSAPSSPDDDDLGMLTQAILYDRDEWTLFKDFPIKRIDQRPGIIHVYRSLSAPQVPRTITVDMHRILDKRLLLAVK